MRTGMPYLDSLVPSSRLWKLLPLATAAVAVAGTLPRSAARAEVAPQRVYLASAITAPKLKLTPAAVNEAGQVVGRIDGYRAPITRPFRWQEGRVELLPFGTGSTVIASAINNDGLIAGSADAVSAKQWHPLFWSSGVLIDLGFRSIVPAGADVGLFGVNDQGQAVGGTGHAFLRDGEVTTDLGTLGGPSSVAYALNEVGQVVGSADVATGAAHAFLWQNGVMRDLGTLGGDESVAYDVNESGQVVGTSALASGARHAFLWENGVMRDLGAFPRQNISAARAINDAGQIVGYSRRLESDLASSVGVVFTEDGPRALTGSVRDRAPWSITDARDINNRGQIVGLGNHLGTSTGVLLTPAANDLSASWTSTNVRYRGIRAPRTTLEGDLLIRNGGERTVGLIAVKFYLSLDSQVDGSDQIVARKLVSLPPAGQVKVQLRAPLARGQAVSGLKLIAVIDADQIYTEEDETNNVVVSTPLP